MSLLISLSDLTHHLQNKISYEDLSKTLQQSPRDILYFSLRQAKPTPTEEETHLKQFVAKRRRRIILNEMLQNAEESKT